MRYNYRVDEFPARKFPDSPQIGWLAEEVQELAPELVSADGEGYLGVAYAHATVLVAQALQEMEAAHKSEMKEFQLEMSAMRGQISAQMSNMKQQSEAAMALARESVAQMQAMAAAAKAAMTQTVQAAQAQSRDELELVKAKLVAAEAWIAQLEKGH